MSKAPLAMAADGVRSLRSWSGAELSGLAERLGVVWRDWCSEWGLSAAPVTCWNDVAAKHLHSTQWNWCAVGHIEGQVAMWFGTPESHGTQWLRSGLFGAHAVGSSLRGSGTSLADDLAQRGLMDLSAGLSEELGLLPVGLESEDVGDVPMQDRLMWSGAVKALLPLCEGSIGAAILHLGPAAVNQCLKLNTSVVGGDIRPPVTSVLDALGERAVTLSVNLSSVELELGLLQSLRVGDVVTLPHELHAPLTVHWADGGSGQERLAPVGRAHLGRRAQFRAVEILPPATPSHIR